MLVENIMTTPVISVDPSASIQEAAALMLAHRISGLPVVRRDGTLVGMLTEGDFLRRGELGTERKRSWWLELLVSPGKIADEYVHTHGRKVEEVMSNNVATTPRNAPLDDVVTTMNRHNVKRLPVVENGKVIGIIARSDLLRALARAQPSSDPVAAGDERIRTDIEAELAKQSWGHGSIHVNVKDGAVILSGVILDDRERQAARVAAENVAGVKSVSDEIVWVEPMSGMVISPADLQQAG
ncbi:CBS domain-containing protein [Roseiarcaceae bacterium H3SJ34-1]|uniref:CBS domain-containing protein n=1 Tax=Terripilifer ovatus TaxID=3032367 RepID=UPI003AB99032|nr:CBS domain-containing protein [Roseiarcaceae bacterium H3SJ34-1]